MKYNKRTPYLNIYRSDTPVYPNAADQHYVTRKILTIVTAMVSSIGFMTAMLALVTLI